MSLVFLTTYPLLSGTRLLRACLEGPPMTFGGMAYDLHAHTHDCVVYARHTHAQTEVFSFFGEFS